MNNAPLPFETNRWWLAAEVATSLAAVSLPLALGGALESSLWLLAALSFLATLTWLIGAMRNKRRWAWHPVLWLPLAVVAIEVFQLLPMPPFVLALLSPRAADLRESTLVPLGLTAWRPISMDTPSTLRALVHTVALGGIVFTALQLGRSDHARRRLYSAVGAVGGAVAIIGFMHLLAGLDTLFGVYRFAATTPLVSPFGNSNHAAACLTVSSTVAIGLAMSARRREVAIGWAVLALSMGIATFLTFSRGGIGALVITWGLIAVHAASRRTGGLRGAFPWLAIVAVIVGAGLLAFDELETRANTLSTLDKLRATKLQLWPMFARASGAFWPFGMGIGAFELAFSPWQTAQLDVTFTHPENIFFQWGAEVGLPLCVALLGLVAVVLRRLWRGVKGSRVETVMLIACLGLAIHDVLDFSLELNALPTLAAVLLGAIASVTGEADAPRRPVRIFAFAVLAGLTALMVVAAPLGHPTHLEAERHLQAGTSDPERLKTLAHRARTTIDRHPADWVLYATMAQVTSQRGDAQNALAWVNRWLWLRPNDSHAHIAAANALLRLKQRSQALLEFRTAFELGDDSMRDLELALAVASVEHDYERLFIDRPKWLERAWLALNRRDLAEGQVMLEQALAAPLSEAMKLEAQVLLVQSLEGKGQITEALAMLEALPPQQRQTAVIVRARLVTKLGRVDEAIALLEKATTQAPGSVETAIALADALASAGRTGPAREALQRVQPFVGQASVRSDLFQREAALWSADTRYAKALDALMTASQLEPDRADLHYRVAQAHERLGSYISALDEVKKGRALDTASGARGQDAWLEKLQAAQLNRTARAP